MWDSFLILLGLHPILATLLPISLGCVLLLLRKRRYLLIFGCIMLCLGISLGATLHLRWDSFSIHFSGAPRTSNLGKLSILFVGDSITCEGTRPRGFITKTQSFLPFEQHVVCQKGATSIEVVRLLEQASLPQNPAFIIVQSGINDLLKSSKQDQVVSSQEMLLEKLVDKFPNSKVLFLPIHPFKLTNGAIFEFPVLAPVNSPTWWVRPLSFVQDSLLNDGIHLSAHGHTKLALSIIKQIAPPLKKNLKEIAN